MGKIIGKIFALSPNVYLLMCDNFFAFIWRKNTTLMVNFTDTFSHVDKSSH